MAYSNINWKAIAWAVQEIYWAYVPLVVLVFAMALLGQTHKLADMPDFLIVVAILFGESSSKISRIKRRSEDIQSLYNLGNLAFALSIIIWVFSLIFNSQKIPGLANMIDIKFYYLSCIFLWICAFTYSIYIRVLIYDSKDND